MFFAEYFINFWILRKIQYMSISIRHVADSHTILSMQHLSKLQYAKYCSLLKLSYCNIFYGSYIGCSNLSQLT